VAEPFGAWCDHAIEPWVADHIAIDGGMVRRWQGEDLDLSIRSPPTSSPTRSKPTPGSASTPEATSR
jgi:hypothetical protein